MRAAKQLACSVVTGDNVGKFVLRHAQVTNLGGGLTSEMPGYPGRQHVWQNRYEFLSAITTILPGQCPGLSGSGTASVWAADNVSDYIMCLHPVTVC